MSAETSPTKFAMQPMDEHQFRQRRSLRRLLRAQVRDTRVLIGETRGALILLLVLVFGSAILFRLLYIDPVTNRQIEFSQALYSSLALLFFENVLAFPNHRLLQFLYFLIPIAGLIAVIDGFVRFGTALINKRERGQKWQTAMASTYSGHVIICGIGKVGYRVAVELLKLDREVVAIELDPNCRFLEKAQALGIPVLIADARRPETLLKAGVEKADVVVPCTEDELTNLDIALDARELNSQIKVVMRMFDPDFAARIEKGFGIHTAFSVSALAAPTIAAASMRVSVRSSFYVGDSLLNISEVTVHPEAQIVGWTVQQLEDRLNLSVVSYVEGEHTVLHPPAQQLIAAHGKVIIVASLDTLDRLAKINP